MMRVRSKLTVLSATLVLSSACASEIRRFPLAPPMWEDSDRNHVPERASKYYSGLMADGADQMVFRPLADVFWLPTPGESVNVNAIDEVPNSAWFTNRIGFHEITPERAAQGACGDDPDLDPTKGPWVVNGAKPNGANPGFFIKAPDGQRYLLKFDGNQQPTRATTADVVGSKIYWTAGFFTPCNHVIYFPEEIFEIDPEATAENEVGEDVPITQDDINKVLVKAFRTKGGLLRASASRFVPGRPIGPFVYEDTRGDDPNDVIDHEDRRELRASRLLAAWINHFDTREQNTLDVWVKEEDREFIKHFIIDWGDSFGSRWPHDAVSRRIGRSYYFDYEHVFFDLISFGLIPRDYNTARPGKFEIFGYFTPEPFTPSEWRGGYANPAFERMTANDALWLIRIMSAMTPEHIRAMVQTGKLPDQRHEDYLVWLLLYRRQKIFEEYLTQYPPLANFALARRNPLDPRQSLCFEDLAVLHNVADPEVTTYKFRFRGGPKLGTTQNKGDEEQLGWLQFNPDSEHPHRSCIVLPIGHRRPADFVPETAKDDHPLRYGVLDIYIHQEPSVIPTSAMSLHFYDLGPERGFRLVGIERHPKAVVPDRY